MEMLEMIKSRRSTRRYQAQQIEDEKLEAVLDAGRHAPSGGNNQTTHFLVVQSRAVLDELARLVVQEFAAMEDSPDLYRSIRNSIRAAKAGGYIFHFNAPTLIITANKEGYGNAMADCACALENMMLEANALDLGTCWVNQLKWLNENPVICNYLRSLGMLADEKVHGAIALGYADAEDGLPIRKPLPRTGNPVTYIR